MLHKGRAVQQNRSKPNETKSLQWVSHPLPSGLEVLIMVNMCGSRPAIHIKMTETEKHPHPHCLHLPVIFREWGPNCFLPWDLQRQSL